MRSLIITVVSFLLCLSLSLTAQTKSPTSKITKGITNADVIAMVKLGLADDIIVSKIRNETNRNFDTSVGGLKTLKASHVSDAVIRVMVSPDALAKAEAPENKAAKAADNLTSSLALSDLFARQAYLFLERMNKLGSPLSPEDFTAEGIAEFQFESSGLERDLKRTREFDLQTDGDRALMLMLEHGQVFLLHERTLEVKHLENRGSKLPEIRSVGCLMAIEQTIQQRKYDPNAFKTKYCNLDEAVLNEMRSEGKLKCCGLLILSKTARDCEWTKPQTAALKSSIIPN
jgi:hypothetical protein